MERVPCSPSSSPVNTMKFLVSWIVRFVLEPGWIIVGRWKWRKQVEEDGWMEYNSPRVGIGGKIRKSRSRLSIGRFYPASWTDPDLSITRITLSLSPHLSRSHSFATEGTRAIFPSRQKEPAPCFLRSLLIFMYIFFLFLSSTSVQRGSNIKISKFIR